MSKNEIYIHIVGSPMSGKTAVSKYIAQKLAEIGIDAGIVEADDLEHQRPAGWERTVLQEMTRRGVKITLKETHANGLRARHLVGLPPDPKPITHVSDLYVDLKKEPFQSHTKGQVAYEDPVKRMLTVEQYEAHQKRYDISPQTREEIQQIAAKVMKERSERLKKEIERLDTAVPPEVQALAKALNPDGTRYRYTGEEACGLAVVEAVCECGAAKTGVKPRQPGHSSWCPAK